MNLYSKRRALANTKFAFNKLTHHLFALKAKIDSLSEEIRQEELALHIATKHSAITYIPEGKFTKKNSITSFKKGQPVSSALAKKYLDYAQTLSNDSRQELRIALRDLIKPSDSSDSPGTVRGDK